jgi:hypothetical protein
MTKTSTSAVLPVVRTTPAAVADAGRVQLGGYQRKV